MAELEVKLDGNKWKKSRVCGCGDCTFYSLEERPVCPQKDSPEAIQLWYIDPKYYGCKDYVDPQDFLSPPAFNERELEVIENLETPQEDSTHASLDE